MVPERNKLRGAGLSVQAARAGSSNACLTFAEMVERALSDGTVYAAAIFLCPAGFGDRTVFGHLPVKSLLKGERGKRTVIRGSSAQWGLPLVLETDLGEGSL